MFCWDEFQVPSFWDPMSRWWFVWVRGFIGRIMRWNRCFSGGLKPPLINHITHNGPWYIVYCMNQKRFQIFIHENLLNTTSNRKNLSFNDVRPQPQCFLSFFGGGLRLHSSPRGFWSTPVGLDAKHRFRNHQCCLLHPFEEDTICRWFEQWKNPKRNPVVV